MSFQDDILTAAGFGQEREPEISWATRLAQAAYTPPSGLRITFDYEDLKRVITKKTTAFDFPDADGQLVQDHGVGARTLPMRVFFWGPDCDLQANVFEAAVSETGEGTLESPLYGEHPVVPFGEIERRDDLRTAANQTIFDVLFVKTIGRVYPTGQEDPASAVQSALEAFGDAGAADFATSLDQGSVSLNQGILDTINGLTAQVADGLGHIAAVQDVVNDQFQDAVDTINFGIDTLIHDPLALAQETQNMIQTPSTALSNIGDRLDGYSNLAGSIFGVSDSVSEPGGPGGGGPQIGSNTGEGNDAESPNRFHTRKLFVSNYVAGAALSTIYTDTSGGGASALVAVQRRQADAAENNLAAKNKFITAQQALEAAANILSQLDAYVAWQDANYASINGDTDEFLSTPANTDTGGTLQALQAVVGLSAGFLIQLSFSLQKEKHITLDRDRNILELCGELYGATDSVLDFFMDSNDLSGDEIFELKRGRRIVYYVP